MKTKGKEKLLENKKTNSLGIKKSKQKAKILKTKTKLLNTTTKNLTPDLNTEKIENKSKKTAKSKSKLELDTNVEECEECSDNASISNSENDSDEKVKSLLEKMSPPKKKSKKKKKKKKTKPDKDSNELNQLTLEYLNSWKSDRKNWKFEKVKQIRLMMNMFDEDKLPHDSFEIFLKYMDKASKGMKELIKTRSSKVIEEVEEWNELTDEEKLTKPKPEKYGGYERARQLLQYFE